ncbi:hypothetical protein OG709_35855 (plasmid) [Streptomyces sp. NBC_01267]|uniref:hypothetical protein n=1 Tax=Streptomyces sp. NBC_01267 TaxID=2903805 RepID=UPI002E31776A|nr:hypothetical protein [Streptomyces sp. NBC_01267]
MSQTRVDWIRGITVRQPWATCLITGDKTIENRPSPGWPLGLYLLHAGLAVERAALRLPLVATTIRGRHLERGAVIGVARLTDVHPGDGRCTPWAEPGSPFHLVFTDVQELPLPIPIPAGALGPWKPSEDLVDQVRLQLPDLHAPEGTP